MQEMVVVMISGGVVLTVKRNKSGGIEQLPRSQIRGTSEEAGRFLYLTIFITKTTGWSRGSPPRALGAGEALGLTEL